MSLATRCTACGTIFRVVQDQLKVSEGWVRCGRCQQVFNALETLFDLDREAPPPWPTAENPAWDMTMPLAPGATPPRPPATAVPQTPVANPAATAVPAASGAAPSPGSVAEPASPRAAIAARRATLPAAAPRGGIDIDTTVVAPSPPAVAAPAPVAPPPVAPSSAASAPAASAQPAPVPVTPPPAPTPPPPVAAPSFLRALSREPAPPPPPPPVYEDHDDEGESSGFADARFNLDLIDHDALEVIETEEPVSTLADSPTTDAPVPPMEPAEPVGAVESEETQEAAPELPLFVQQVERAERWRHPAVRTLMVMLLLVSSLGLAAQAAVQFRTSLVAQWPATRMVIDPLCAQVGCRIEPPRRLDSLTVDSSGLVRSDTPGVYRLSVVLHNRAGLAVRMPAVELSLTDEEGKLVSRKALMPAQLGATQASIGANADATLQARLSTGSLRVVGYTVEIFYP